MQIGQCGSTFKDFKKQSKGPDLEKSGFSVRDAAAMASNGKSREPLKADTGGPFTRTTYTADRGPAIAIASVKWVISMSKNMGSKVYDPNFSLFAGKVPIRIDISPALFLFLGAVVSVQILGCWC